MERPPLWSVPPNQPEHEQHTKADEQVLRAPLAETGVDLVAHAADACGDRVEHAAFDHGLCNEHRGSRERELTSTGADHVVAIVARERGWDVRANGRLPPSACGTAP